MTYNMNSAAAAFAYAHIPCQSSTTPSQPFTYSMTTVPTVTMFPTSGYNAGMTSRITISIPANIFRSHRVESIIANFGLKA
uniref:RRM domain-containing protein n=1 Tax=Angiostrongylus cantonensis TaxID=6313 RepID=A0A0K0D432_ANGCA